MLTAAAIIGGLGKSVGPVAAAIQKPPEMSNTDVTARQDVNNNISFGASAPLPQSNITPWKNYIIYGAILVGGLFLLSKIKRPKRVKK